jgi:hypothetical protein
MAAKSIVRGDFHFNGDLSCDTFAPPAGCIDNEAVESGAEIDADKVERRITKTYAQNANAASAADRRVIHVARKPGVLTEVKAGVVVACLGDSTITVNVKKNGTTVLTAVVVLDNTNTAFAIESGAVSGAADDYVTGDVFDVTITVSAGTGTLGFGVFVETTFDETAL